jgi:hypothetical protein
VASSALRWVTVAFLYDPRVQAPVKAAEAKEIVWRKADLIEEGHCRGTGSMIFRATELLLKDSRCPSLGVL